jgi:glutamate carboxypeptidase
MKGGLVVMLSALKALQKAKLLDGATITVFLTGDEESSGQPLEVARGDMIAAAKESDAALCFESGIRRDGKDYVSTARRGYTGWTLSSTGTPAHSSAIFSERVGDGAVFEIARVLDRFNRELREPNLTYNAGLLAAGQGVELRADGAGSLQGKPNIVPAEARAIGEFRALTLDQVERVQEKMRAIVADARPGTKTELRFEPGFPPMAPSAGNSALFAEYAAASLAMGLPAVHELDPMLRGAGDSAFVSPYVPTITGLGAVGEGSHTSQESVDLSLMPLAAKRAALTIYRLSRTKLPR